MIRSLSRLWARLNLIVRVSLVVALSLLYVGIFAAYQTSQFFVSRAQEDLSFEYNRQADTLETLVSDVIFHVDKNKNEFSLERLDKLLSTRKSGPDVTQISFRDTSNVIALSQDVAIPLEAPLLFARWCKLGAVSLNRPVILDGVYYGLVSLSMSPNRIINQYWHQYLYLLKVLLFFFVIALLGIWIVLHRALRPLFTLAEAGKTLAQGDLSVRVKTMGSPEMQMVLLSFNQMAENIQETLSALRQSEAHLGKSNQILSSVLDHTHVMAVLLDSHFNFIWVNPTYAATCLQEPSFFPGKNHFDLYPNEETQAIFQQVIDTGEPFFATARPFEFPDQPERGVTYWDWSLIPVDEGNGEVSGLVFTLLEVTDRVRAETAIKENERGYRSLFENLLNGYAYCKMIFDQNNQPQDFIYLDVNRAFESKTGLKNVVGRKVSEVIPGIREADQELLEIYGRVSLTGRPEIFEIYVEALSMWFSVSVYCPQKEHFVSIFDVITERKEAEQLLQESENKFRNVFDNSAFGKSITSIDGSIEVNQALCEMLGYSMEDLAHENWQNINHPDDYDVTQKYIEKLLAGRKKSVRFEKRYFKKDGTIVWADAHTALQRDEDGNPQYFITGIIDITERKQMEEALRNSEQRLKLAQQAAGSGTWDWDMSSGQLEWSSELFRLFGLDPHEAEATFDLWDQVLHPDDKVEAHRRVEQSIAEDLTLDSDYRVVFPDGQIRWIRALGSTIYDQEKRPVRMAGICFDITARKHAEIENEMLLTQLNQAQKMESVGRLAGGVAHDFNNMLSIILGHAEFALGELDPDSPLIDDLTEIQNAAKRSADLTRQLLAFARKQTVVPRVLDFNQTVESMLNMLRKLVGENIDLKWIPGVDVWPVEMDPSQIDQILANLCVNARDAIADAGNISIETKNTTLDENFCKENIGSYPGEYAALSVADSGCGMDSETLMQLFEPFFTTKELGKGTGLGLSTVYGIVKQNRGFISVQSKLNQGTTFTIYLPRYLSESSGVAKDVPVIQTGQGQETILVVEDEFSVLKLAKRILQGEGYAVLTAQSPGQAIQLARENVGEIDLLITDVVMPEMNGRDLAKNILSFYPNLKRLFMSGYTADVIAHHGVLDQGIYFLQKPFTRQDLIGKVRELLDKQKSSK